MCRGAAHPCALERRRPGPRVRPAPAARRLRLRAGRARRGAPSGRRADHHLRLWYHRRGGGPRRPGGRHRGHRPRPPSPRRRAPPGVRGARSAARRLPLRSEGAVRHGRRIQARAGARAGAGVVASSAASFSGPGGARDRGRRRAAHGRKPHPGAPRAEAARGVPLDGRTGADRNGGPRGRPIKSGHVGFILAPRLNAAGRIGDANDGLRLLLSDDPQEAAAIARELETLNARRQALDQRILDEAVELTERVLRPEDRGLVLAADTWHPGVIGIVASRLVERYGRPTFLIAWEEGSDVGRGSGRSVAGFDLHAALHRVGHHLEKYGGHTMAAGLTIRRERYDAFRVAFLAVAGELLGPDDLVPAQRVDLELSLGLVSDELEKLIRYLEPCGPGNPAPVFGVRQARAVGARRVGTNHLRFTLDDASGALPAIAFQWADAIPDQWLAERLDVAFRLERDEWQGRATLQARVAAMAPSE